jgi:hypothetical protein
LRITRERLLVAIIAVIALLVILVLAGPFLWFFVACHFAYCDL